MTSGLDRGGAEGFLVRLVAGLKGRGHFCGVAALGTQAPLAAPLADAGIEVARVGSGLLLPFLSLRRLARRFHPDVVQGWMYRGNLAALLAARAAPENPAVIWSVRQGLNDLPDSPWRTRRSVAANARLARRPFAIVYNAESAKQQHEALGFSAAGSRVIPNGIDVAAAPPTQESRAAARARLGLASTDFVVALIARWHPVKNHRGFASAAGIFAGHRREARFLLAGSGIDSGNATLTSWLREERITDRVLLLGERSDVPDLLAAADVATLASIGEALPNALLEAMAAGVPCVAPDVGDIAVLIGTTGAVVPADDSRALAAGWETLAAMTEAQRRALGERARLRVEGSYALDRAVDAFEALYREAAGD